MTAEYGQIRDETRLLWQGYRNWLERAERKEFKWPAEDIIRKKQILAALAVVAADYDLIAANAAAFEAWKGSVQC